MMIHLPVSINHSNATQIQKDGLLQLKKSDDILVDASQLQDFDSSVLAILMAWKRISPELHIVGGPEKLETLARVYGLEELFDFKKVLED
ncbi:MAG: STAS domain-containing protein [Betaproteobacteria bacterium]|jgi:ABC-type transporter Mla MlaB component